MSVTQARKRAERPERAETPKRAEAPQRKEAPPSALFRSEALEGRRTQAFGAILLEPRMSQSVFAYGALIAVAIILAALIFGSYTRRAHVNGWLTPSAGLVRVFSPQTGVATHIFVHEGDVVAKDAPLIRISSEVRNDALVGVRGEIVARIGEKASSWRNSRETQGKLLDEQASDLGARVETTRAEEKHLSREVDLQREHVGLSLRALQRMREMRKRDLVALPRLEAAEQDWLDQSARLETVEQQRLASANERQLAEEAARELPLRRTLQIDDVDRSLSTTRQELAEADIQREITITAPEAGVVSGIEAEQGGAVSAAAPLMSVVPDTGDLEAQLFATSRAVGFIRPGQRVLLRYQAYPYQKFGGYEGTVASISRSALNPTELPQTLNGLVSLTGAGEALYAVTVKLDRQSVTAYGKPEPLKPGMALDADVMLDSRRLIEWVFDPLYSLTGSWR